MALFWQCSGSSLVLIMVVPGWLPEKKFILAGSSAALGVDDY
jgi:hypothetical protein